MALKFAANLNFLFLENSSSLVERIGLAHKAGFRAVEIPYPQTCSPIEVCKAQQETGIEVALVNIALGSDHLRLGAACLPGQEQHFQEQLTKTIDFAKQVQCKKIHIMSGLMNEQPFSQLLDTYKKNLKVATQQLEKENMIGIIEPINKYSVPGYFMNSFETALEVLEEVNSKHLRMMLDIFHLQHIRGNISNSFKELHQWIGHMQIAQVPFRNEPDTCGELDYAYVFELIRESGYDDWIGCEYKPKTTTTDGLKWLSKFKLEL